MGDYELNNQYLCSQSKNRTTLVKLELLDSNYTIVDTLEGLTTGGSISLSNDGFVRISGSLEMILSKSLSTDYFKIDLNHLVNIIIKVTDNTTSISSEYQIGICLLNSPTLTRTAEGESKFSVNLVDLFYNFSGEYNGGLENTVVFSVGTPLTTALQGIFTDPNLMGLPISRIKIEPNSLIIPSDITCEAGSSISDLLQSLMDLYMGYELFFDKDGILTYQKIKNYKTDNPIQELINSPVIISYSPKESFENVRNKIIVLGSINETGTETTPIQYSATSELTDVKHPLSTVNIGVRKKVIIDDTNCQSNEACQSEADFMLEKYSNYAETLDLQLLPDYRLLPNRVIIIEYEDDYMSIDNSRWLIDNITIGLKSSDTMSVSCHKLYT